MGEQQQKAVSSQVAWLIYVQIYLLRCFWGLCLYFSLWLSHYYSIPIIITIYILSFLIEKHVFDHYSDVSDSTVINSYVTSDGTLPSWVMYPDVERTAWLNEIIKQMWPFIGNYMERVLIGKRIKGFRLDNFAIGDISPYLCGIKFYAGHNISRRSFVMDIGIIYAGNAVLSGVKRGYKFGIRDIGMSGKLRFVFEPLTTNSPFIGGVSVTIVPTPKFMFSLFDRLYLTRLPILGDIIHSKIKEQITKALVFPNKKEFSLAKGIIKSHEEYFPQGVLLIHVDSVDDIEHDFKPTLFNKEPIAEICVEIVVGASEFRTKYVKGNNFVTFDEYFEAILPMIEGQVMTVRVKDINHPSKKDECLILDLQNICKKGKSRIKLDYEGVVCGSVQIDFIWKTLSDNIQAFSKQSRTMAINAHSSNGLLLVYLDSAARLTNIYLYKGKVINAQGDPSPFVMLACNQQTEKSEICRNTGNPIWQQSFEFIVKNAETDTLRIWIEDSVTNLNLGALVVPFSQLIKAPKMTLNQPFLFSDGANESYVFMKLVLRSLMVKDLENITNDLPAEEMVGRRMTQRFSVYAGALLRIPSGVAEDIDEVDSKERKIRVTLNYKAAKEILHIYIHNAINIVPVDASEDERPNSFIRLRILPNDMRKNRSTTRLCRQSAHPHYNENFQVLMPRMYVTKEITYLGLYIVGSVSKEMKLLGVASIKLTDIDLEKPTTIWYAIDEVEDIESQEATDV